MGNNVADSDLALFSLWQRQTQVSGWMGAYAASNEKIKMFKAGIVEINEMNNTISFRLKTWISAINSYLLKLCS